MVWNHTKYADLANFIPDDIQHLQEAVITSIDGTRKAHLLKRTFFAQAGLDI
jgi:hypothetical protein